MKTSTLLLLAGVSCMAMAEARPMTADTTGAPRLEHYDYSMDLDIARVIKITEIPNVCEVVPMQMVYEDSHGQRHVLEYSVMGRGCGSY
ncbi:Protein of unknown function [Azotobacter beijerinckii]|uniref:DUF2790 domain-containing protein n=1 Tax=Azotobacter beijerinckii TaxID=170623 RepID=A0A1H6SVE5_9GAMM|nr:DUF2790 domain-containing protein [Azotobacter beijerinckii]SEI71893.1 Protein of unknown function [Azotobacter beijerinckii]